MKRLTIALALLAVVTLAPAAHAGCGLFGGGGCGFRPFGGIFARRQAQMVPNTYGYAFAPAPGYVYYPAPAAYYSTPPGCGSTAVTMPVAVPSYRWAAPAAGGCPGGVCPAR